MPTDAVFQTDSPAWKLLRQALGRRWLTALSSVAVMVVSAIATSIYAVLAGPLVAVFHASDKGAESQVSAGQIDFLSSLSLGAIVLGLITVALVRGLAEATRAHAVAALQQGVVRDFRQTLFERLLGFGHQGLQRWGRGELATRLGSEIHGVRTFLHLGLVGGLRNLLMATALATVAFRLDTPVATWGLIGLPVALVVVAWTSAKLRGAQQRLYQSEANAASLSSETAAAVPVLQAYGAQRWAAAKMAHRSGEAERDAIYAERLQAIAPATLELVAALGLGAAWWAVQGAIDAAPPAPRISAVAAVVLLYRPLIGLASSLFGLTAGLACMDRIDQFFALPTDPPQGSRADGHAPHARTGLIVAGVGFSYGTHHVLDGIDLTLRAGDSVAVIGPSGAGKSTLLKLLAGLLSPSAGQIALPNAGREPVAQTQLRSLCAWMPQQSVVFADTILSNITLGDPSPDHERAQWAARTARIHDFVLKRGGYQAEVAEDGSDLSAGQKQRLCFARALYRQAPIWLLDEPTAALDTGTEAAFVAACHRATRSGCIVVIASHRASVVSAMDRVLELRDGILIDRGEHEWKERLATFSKSA